MLQIQQMIIFSFIIGMFLQSNLIYTLTVDDLKSMLSFASTIKENQGKIYRNLELSVEIHSVFSGFQ